jgi:hypothetical protein
MHIPFQPYIVYASVTAVNEFAPEIINIPASGFDVLEVNVTCLRSFYCIYILFWYSKEFWEKQLLSKKIQLKI